MAKACPQINYFSVIRENNSTYSEQNRMRNLHLHAYVDSFVGPWNGPVVLGIQNIKFLDFLTRNCNTAEAKKQVGGINE